MLLVGVLKSINLLFYLGMGSSFIYWSPSCLIEDFNDLFIRTPRENMPECALEFMRIGEDDDDVKCERRGACDYVMSMERKIILEV